MGEKLSRREEFTAKEWRRGTLTEVFTAEVSRERCPGAVLAAGIRCLLLARGPHPQSVASKSEACDSLGSPGLSAGKGRRKDKKTRKKKKRKSEPVCGMEDGRQKIARSEGRSPDGSSRPCL